MEHLKEMYEEIKGKIDIDYLATKCDGQSLFGDVLEICRDYFNKPKTEVWHLATYLIGEYAVDHYLQKELIGK